MKIRQFTLRIISLFLVVLTLVPLFAACKEEELEENQLAVSWSFGKVSGEKETFGQILEEEGYSYSEIITLPKAGTKITFTDSNTEEDRDRDYADQTALVISHWVEENGTWVIEEPGDHYTGLDGRSGEVCQIRRDEWAAYTYITSFDNESIRLCYSSGQTAKDKPRKFPFAKVYAEEGAGEGTLLSSPVDSKTGASAYKDLLVKKFLKNAKNEMWHEELKGLTMYIMGDSYFGGSKNGKQYVWPDLMAQKYEMEFSNWGIGGSTVSNCPNKNYYPMCDRISSMSVGTPDIILLEGGRNDFGKGVPLGTPDDTSIDTFYGGLNSCVAQLKERYPNALIIGVTCWAYTQTVNGQTQQQFADAMKDVCTRNGMPCFDATDPQLCSINMDSRAFRTEYCQDPNDVSHLNTQGMIMVEPEFEKFIAEVYKAFKANG